MTDPWRAPFATLGLGMIRRAQSISSGPASAPSGPDSQATTPGARAASLGLGVASPGLHAPAPPGPRIGALCRDERRIRCTSPIEYHRLTLESPCEAMSTPREKRQQFLVRSLNRPARRWVSRWPPSAARPFASCVVVDSGNPRTIGGPYRTGRAPLELVSGFGCQVTDPTPGVDRSVLDGPAGRGAGPFPKVARNGSETSAPQH